MKKKKYLFILFIVFLCIVYSGCEKKERQSVNTEESKITKNEGSGDKIIKINFSHFHLEGQPTYQSTKNAIEKFNSENKGKYEIVQDALPSGETYQTNISALATTGELPELCMLLGSSAIDYGKQGIVMDVRSLFQDAGAMDKIKKENWTEFKWKDAIYAMPLVTSNYGYIFYNTDIFNKAGVSEFPKNIDEFLEVCKKIKSIGYIPMALGIKQPLFADSITFSTFVNKYVGNEWSENIFAQNGKSHFTDPEYIQALTDFQKLGTCGYVFNDNFAGLDNTERLQLYLNGEAAMISSGQWENSLISESAPDIAECTQVAAWPGPLKGAKAGDSVEASTAWGIAVSSNISEEALPGAIDFITHYMCSEDTGRYLAEEKGQFVSWKVDYDTSKLIPLTQKMVEFSSSATACRNWDSSLITSVKEIYQRGLQELLLGLKTPEQLAREMQKEYDEAITLN